MPTLHRRVRRRPLRWAPGGIATYGIENLFREISYVALNFHWGREELLDLEHAERQRYVALINELSTDG
ncbi:DUF6760 family protein [Gordonia sp. LSe1-13]|uniref:DUF6760 family protein n=1 Tax=Gordonia sesuvii TaxID=3116777 RepID=A0ABU7MC23_9ACTN|nr:DUF6760 family protein [Gordonia sp. LSe1-13]